MKNDVWSITIENLINWQWRLRHKISFITGEKFYDGIISDIKVYKGTGKNKKLILEIGGSKK